MKKDTVGGKEGRLKSSQWDKYFGREEVIK